MNEAKKDNKSVNRNSTLLNWLTLKIYLFFCSSKWCYTSRHFKALGISQGSVSKQFSWESSNHFR